MRSEEDGNVCTTKCISPPTFLPPLPFLHPHTKTKNPSTKQIQHTTPHPTNITNMCHTYICTRIHGNVLLPHTQRQNTPLSLPCHGLSGKAGRDKQPKPLHAGPPGKEWHLYLYKNDVRVVFYYKGSRKGECPPSIIISSFIPALGHVGHRGHRAVSAAGRQSDGTHAGGHSCRRAIRQAGNQAMQVVTRCGA